VIGARPALGRRGVVAGVTRDAAYVDAGGFVVVLTVGPPVLPNGVQVGRLPAVGDEVVVRADEAWDPTLRLDRPPALVPPDPDDLVRAVESRDVEAAALVGARLIGRGPGLTPEGDDLVAGVCAVIAAGDWPGALREAWVGALIGGDLRRRTTALSATLLELAALGMGPEPLQALVAGDPGALARLEAIGHSTGRAYARGAAIALQRVTVPSSAGLSAANRLPAP
jgi:hypothetical protein